MPATSACNHAKFRRLSPGCTVPLSPPRAKPSVSERVTGECNADEASIHRAWQRRVPGTRHVGSAVLRRAQDVTEDRVGEVGGKEERKGRKKRESACV